MTVYYDTIKTEFRYICDTLLTDSSVSTIIQDAGGERVCFTTGPGKIETYVWICKQPVKIVEVSGSYNISLIHKTKQGSKTVAINEPSKALMDQNLKYDKNQQSIYQVICSDYIKNRYDTI